MSLNYKQLFFFLVMIPLIGCATSLSSNSTVSLLTCDEGTEIYALFGHGAIRIQDKSQSIDEIYNWGMFEFSENQAEFGYDFAKGKLVYKLGRQKFQHFIYEYIYYKRGVREQQLNLNLQQKQKLYDAILKNYLPENRNYKYDFFYDNCSSRIRDLLITSIGNKLVLAKHPDADKYSFREIIDFRLNSTPWLDLGIDLVLGKKIDTIVSNHHLMFLPSYLGEILDASYVIDNLGGKVPLVKNKTELLTNEIEIDSDISSISIYFWVLLVFTLIVGIINRNRFSKFWFGLILLIGSLLSIVLVFMWVGTDHDATKDNLNLLWANPLLLLSFVSIFSKKLQAKLTYFFLSMTILFFMVVLFWIISPQEFNTAIRPLIIVFTLVHYFLFNNSKKLTNRP